MKTTKNIDIYFPGITSELNLNIVKDSNMKRHIVSCHCNNTSSIGLIIFLKSNLSLFIEKASISSAIIEAEKLFVAQTLSSFPADI